MKRLVKELVKKLIGGIIGTALVLGFFYVLGLIMQVIECHFWLMIPLTIYVIYLMLKMASE